MATYEEILAMLTPSPEQMRQQKIQGLLSGLGAGLLSGRGWQSGIQNAGLLAANNVNAVPGQMQADALNKLRLQEGAQQMADRDQERADKQKQRAADQAWQQQLPSLFAQPSPAQQIGSGAPTLDNAAKLAAQPQQQKWQVYEKVAQQALQAGRTADAKNYFDLADKFRPKVKNENTGTDQQGNRVRYVTYEDGTTQVLPVGPDKEKLNFVNTGGQVGVGLNPYTGKQESGGLSATMSPEQIDASKRGWAGLGLEERKFGYQQAQDANNAATGKKPSDQQLSARGFLTRMQNAGGIVNDLEGKGYAPGFFSAYSQGAREIPVVGQMANWATNSVAGMVSPESQQFRQAQEDWVRAKLRKESGAVIGKDEMDGELRTYFPQPGDGRDVVEQKKRARAVAEQQMAIQGGIERYEPPQGGRQAAGQINSQQAYDALPSGAEYTAPDGTRRRKK